MLRFLGKEYDGEGITVAVVDSGIRNNDPRIDNPEITGWRIELGATGHALLHPDHDDTHGHGTEIAAAVLRTAPKVNLVAVKIMGDSLRTSAELMAAGIETAARNGAHIINLSIGTPNMGKALLLRDCIGQAVEMGSVVLAAGHPRGDRAYPADLPETVGVASDPSCGLDRFFYFQPDRYPFKRFANLSDKILAHGHEPENEDGKKRFRGSGLATAHMSGYAACLRQALPSLTAAEFIERLKLRCGLPYPELGYAA